MNECVLVCLSGCVVVCWLRLGNLCCSLFSLMYSCLLGSSIIDLV